MRTIYDTIAIILFIAFCVWVFLIWNAQPNYRPIRFCQPLFFVDRLAVDVVAAGTGQSAVSADVNDGAGDLNNACLGFGYNLFVRGNSEETQQ